MTQNAQLLLLANFPKRNLDLPDNLFLVQWRQSIYQKYTDQPCSISLPVWSLTITHLGQLVLSQDSPSLFILGLSDKKTGMS